MSRFVEGFGVSFLRRELESDCEFYKERKRERERERERVCVMRRI